VARILNLQVETILANRKSPYKVGNTKELELCHLDVSQGNMSLWLETEVSRVGFVAKFFFFFTPKW